MKNFLLCKLSDDTKGCSDGSFSFFVEYFMVEMFIWRKKKSRFFHPSETTVDTTRKKKFFFYKKNLISDGDFYENKSCTDFFASLWSKEKFFQEFS